MFKEFYKPATLNEAVQMRHSIPQSVYLAGGAHLNSLAMKDYDKGPITAAISVANLPMGGISLNNDMYRIGANVTVQFLLDNQLTPNLLKICAKQFTNRHVRNVATVGGNLSLNRSSSNLISAFVALGALVELMTKDGTVLVTVEDYIFAHDDKDLVTAVLIPKDRAAAYCASRLYARTSSDISILLATVSFDLSDDSQEPLLSNVKIALGGVAPTQIHLGQLEKHLEGKAMPSREAIESFVKPLLNPMSDLRGGSEFKREVMAVLVAKALHDALKSKEIKIGNLSNN